MVITVRKKIDQTVLEMKQASLGRMLVQAKTLHQQGKLRTVTSPTSRVRSKSEQLRVRVVSA